MTNTIFTKFYDAPKINKKEILRYMGCKNNTEDIDSLIDDCLHETLSKLSYKVCYRQFAICQNENSLNLSFMTINSHDLSKNLKGCENIIVFAATIGIEVDRLISKYGKISPAKSLCIQAIGAERIESLCNTFNNDIKSQLAEKNLFTRPRFSPGYGDLPLTVQKDFFRVLDCTRKIGLSLNDSLLMSPSKSVTAIIGICKEKTGCSLENTCDNCKKQNCSFRR